MQRQVNLDNITYSNTILDEMNFYNLVHYMKPELKQILKGDNAKQVIPGDRLRRNLVKEGILVLRHMGGGKQIWVSGRVKRILEEEEV